MRDLALKAVGAVLGLVLVFSAVNWYNKYQQNIGYQRAVAEHTKEENTILKDMIKKNDQLQDQVAKATKEGELRAKELETLRVAARNESVGLRRTISAVRGQLSQLSAEACRPLADRGLELLDRCQERYRDMAERAQVHADYVKTLKDAWPGGTE